MFQTFQIPLLYVSDKSNSGNVAAYMDVKYVQIYKIAIFESWIDTIALFKVRYILYISE